MARGDSPAPPAKTTGRTELLQNGGNLTSSGSSVHSVKTRSTHSLAVAVEKETTGDRRDDGVRVQERASVPAESPSLAAEVSKEEEEELEVEEEVEEEEEEVEEVVVEEEEEEEEGRREEEEVKVTITVVVATIIIFALKPLVWGSHMFAQLWEDEAS